ncbi:hypothetical protein [Halorussus sp. MSC15.2]|uniref:hypothetical protein n=1 Tax=Halorussus sp. MSC15.2 TaxID=2283638 RepID=UPI0013D2D2F4|nr:hypothetical protein [Halorussus sp. MSC15.2]NEU58353.1 hypothetical protein [Halorussus sp. MSC15.2]
MSAERDAAESDAPERTAEYYVVSPSPTTKKRHRPDETGDEPACRAFLHRDDAEWRKLTPRQTVFYDDCTNCFPRES